MVVDAKIGKLFRSSFSASSLSLSLNLLMPTPIIRVMRIIRVIRVIWVIKVIRSIVEEH